MWKSTGHWTLLRLFLFSGKPLLETGSLTYCTLSITLRWKDQYTSSKRFYILCNTLANNTKGLICLREREVCVDESIIGFQGRTPATQYMPNKHHHRWGLRFWCLCESSSGYTWNFYIYGGADDAVGETIVDKSGDVVIWLISPLLGYGYHMYTDNYFTSIHLAMYLYNHRTYLTGSTRSNRVGLPEPVRQKLAKKDELSKRTTISMCIQR